jgi:hypothetical protein
MLLDDLVGERPGSLRIAWKGAATNTSSTGPSVRVS